MRRCFFNRTFPTSNFQLGYSFYWCTNGGSHEDITDYRYILDDDPVRKLYRPYIHGATYIVF